MTGTQTPWYNRAGLALLTDLYELTMMAGYYRVAHNNREVALCATR